MILKNSDYSSLQLLNEDVVRCMRCPRLVAFREQVPTKNIFKDESYWRRPIPGFGDHKGWLMIIGLAPSAHGGNRTGRIFTGDLSGKFLIESLYESGFANQPTSISANDGLKLKDCYVTAAVKCVPPLNQPLPQEIINCNFYLQNELQLLENLTHILVLGKLALDALFFSAKTQGKKLQKHPFKHGESYYIEGYPKIYASYHPSPQNTNTGKLTKKMFQELLTEIKQSQILESL